MSYNKEICKQQNIFTNIKFRILNLPFSLWMENTTTFILYKWNTLKNGKEIKLISFEYLPK